MSGPEKVKKTEFKKAVVKRRKKKKTCFLIKITAVEGSTDCPAGYKELFSGDYIQVFLDKKNICHKAPTCKLSPCKNK